MNLPELLHHFDSYQRVGNGKYKATCPMPNHGDSDPSVSVSQDITTGNILMMCWGCGSKAPQLVEAMDLTIHDLFGDPGHPAAISTNGSVTEPVSIEDRERLEQRVSLATENLEKASDYILERFNLSVATGRYLRLGVDKEWNAPYLIIPFLDPSGNLVAMQGRRLVEGDPRWKNPSGSGWSKIGVFGWDLDGPIIICEGPSDSLSVIGRAKYPSLAIRGASNSTEAVCQQIKEWIGNRSAIVVGDNDQAGEKFAQEISERVGIIRWSLPSEYSDISEFLADGRNLDECVELATAVQQESILTPADYDDSLKQRIQQDMAHVIYDEPLLTELSQLPQGRRDAIFAAVIATAGHGNIGNARLYMAAIAQTLRDRVPPAPAHHGGGGVHANPPNAQNPNIPTIIWNVEDQRHVTENEIRTAMDAYSNGEFYRSATGQYIKVVSDDLVNLKEAGVLSMLSQMGHWRVIEGQREKGHVPPDAARTITDPSWKCGLPEIKRRVEVPFMLEDGSIVSDTGYHSASGVYLLPRDTIVVPEVPSRITQAEVDQAKSILEDVTEGFKFKNESSKTNLIAMTLTSPLRELFRNNPMVPMLTSTAPQSGSGKGTSIRLPLSTCGVGPYSLATTAYNSDENEFEKKLVGKLLKKTTYIFLDNIRLGVNSSVLEQMLTAANYDGRTLGYSEVNALSTLVLWVSTLQSTGSFNRDLTRRTVPVELTKNFKGSWTHKNIDGYLADMRGQMIWACFIVARKWLQEGGPISSVRLDGYGGWTECIGGMLEHVLGYEGFLGNLDSFRKTQDQNAMTVDGILERWLVLYGEAPQPARMAVEDYEDPALHQLLNLHNPGSTRQVINALTRLLDSQEGFIINNSHQWEPLGVQQHKEGAIKLYKCSLLRD